MILPLELLRLILNNLPTKDLASASLVNQTFRTMVNSLLFKKVRIWIHKAILNPSTDFSNVYDHVKTLTAVPFHLRVLPEERPEYEFSAGYPCGNDHGPTREQYGLEEQESLIRLIKNFTKLNSLEFGLAPDVLELLKNPMLFWPKEMRVHDTQYPLSSLLKALHKVENFELQDLKLGEGWGFEFQLEVPRRPACLACHPRPCASPALCELIRLSENDNFFCNPFRLVAEALMEGSPDPSGASTT